jgi:hypothetical protein
MLSDDLKIRATKYCKQKGISLGSLLRAALERELEEAEKDRQVQDCLFADQAVYQGEVPMDISINHDAYLY